MLVLDTSAWVEWVTATPTGNEVGLHLPPRDEWIVPTMVRLELSKWLLRVAPEEMSDWILGVAYTCQIVPLNNDLADRAAEACVSHKLATADAVIYATARAHNADLLTCDGHFEGLPGVIYVPKVAQ